MLESFGMTEAGLALFVGGLAGGVAVGLVAARVASGRAPSAGLVRRVDELELRLLRATGYGAVLRAARAATGGARGLASDGLALALDAGDFKRSWLLNRPDTEQLARELAESIKTNLEAALDAGNAIAENGRLGDPAERREVTRTVKRAGEKLTVAFCERHGALIRGSATPASMKAKLEQFFTQVAGLKRAIADLPAEPPPQRLIEIVERVVELINTAAAIAEEIQAAGA